MDYYCGVQVLHQPFSGPPETIPEVRPEESSDSSVHSDNTLSSIVVGVGVTSPQNTTMPDEHTGSLLLDTNVTGFTTLDSLITPSNPSNEVANKISAPTFGGKDGNKRSTGPTHINMSELTVENRDRLLSLIPRDPQTGTVLSAGSIVHELGTCRPCVFAGNAERPCVYGMECLFCHFHHDIRKRSRLNRKQREEARKMRETQNSIGFSLGSPLLGDDASAEEIYTSLVGHAHAVELQKITLDHLLDGGDGNSDTTIPSFYTSSIPSRTIHQYNNTTMS